MLDLLVPDGPLHPADALAGLAAGSAVALVARRRAATLVPAVIVAVWATVRWRHGGVILDGYSRRDDTLTALLLTLGVVGASLVRPLSWARVGPAALGALMGVWAVVPDTEVPLVAGGVLASALLVTAASRRSFRPHRMAGLLAVLPVAAAVAGSVGRPERLEPALGLGALGMVCAATAMALFGRAFDTQRAGTPRTVDLAGTSSTTTAPAPTIAS